MNDSVQFLWTSVGIVGALLFYGRFYVQWIASEIAKKSVVPVAFWYLSGCGSILLLAFAVWSQSPLGALGQNLNIVIYGRNLVHISRENDRLSNRSLRIANLTLFIVAGVAATFATLTWFREYRILESASDETIRTTWFWLGVGVVGQGLFAARFVIQWVATEIKQRSHFPWIFWPLSIVAATLQGSAFVQRQEWVFAAGMLATIVIYARNMMLLRKGNVGGPVD